MRPARFHHVLSLAIALGGLIALDSAAAPKFVPTPAQEAEAHAVFAAMELKQMLKAEAMLLAAPVANRNMILQLAGGALNQKFQLLTTTFVEEKHATKQEAVLAMGVSLQHLANLAQQLQFHEASQC